MLTNTVVSISGDNINFPFFVELIAHSMTHAHPHTHTHAHPHSHTRTPSQTRTQNGGTVFLQQKSEFVGLEDQITDQ